MEHYTSDDYISNVRSKESASKLRDIQYSNSYQIPKLKKIVLNRGLGDASQNTKVLESSLQEFQKITGQKALIHYSKKSIAGFHLRKKMPVGVAVTLRRNFMYGFLDRLINLALPRIRDFPGLPLQSFDGCGNYNFGLDEQLMFPEIHYDQIQQIRGMDIAIVTTAKNDREGFALLQAFGFPFQQSSIKDTTLYFKNS
uniref:Large ribosomal subunit protein uL5c n=1 Tax=Pseudochlorodesmis sp. HV01306a TaxID=2358488 RepID=A0A386AY08_9CHLO|nr:ribosomal protein L5 [Pseudochlorodesmis sp. HV01306a]